MKRQLTDVSGGSVQSWVLIIPWLPLMAGWGGRVLFITLAGHSLFISGYTLPYTLPVSVLLLLPGRVFFLSVWLIPWQGITPLAEYYYYYWLGIYVPRLGVFYLLAGYITVASLGFGNDYYY